MVHIETKDEVTKSTMKGSYNDLIAELAYAVAILHMDAIRDCKKKHPEIDKHAAVNATVISFVEVLEKAIGIAYDAEYPAEKVLPFFGKAGRKQ